MPNLVSIVDDDPAVRESTLDLLNSAGLVAETFKSADEFLKSGRVSGASCLIADLQMPGMSGLELHDRLRRAGRNIPTILITAFPTRGDRARAIKVGVLSYLSKPFSDKDLLSHVAAAHSLRHGRDGYDGSEKDPKKSSAEISLFHEHWWLSAVTGGRYEEAVVKQGSDIIGRLPYVIVRRGPFRTIRMPRFTHLLGPTVNAGVGKPQTQLTRRLSITRSLIDQLPPSSFFLQHFDPSIDGGMALADGLAFQDRGFSIAPQYTFSIDCRKSSEELWTSMHFKTRQHIRRAEEKYVVDSVDDPHAFIAFYLKNIEASGKRNQIEFDRFPVLFSECRSRNCGEVLAAFAADGSPVAMVYLVWSHSTLYYLLSTRARDKGDNGSVNFLLWCAIKKAHQLGLIFDLDGVYSSGTARFLSGFGGEIKTRLTVRRGWLPYRALQFVKRQYRGDETHLFT
jgi:FixJ family two-component response regulator